MASTADASASHPSGVTPSSTASTSSSSTIRASTSQSNGAPEAGPSRPHAPEAHGGSAPRSNSPPREITPHLDLATYPTPQLLRLLARLLQQIASSNDQLRSEQADEGEEADDAHEPPPSDAASLASATTSQSRSSTVHDSPTNELFHDDPPPVDLAAGDKLFTASKASLSQPQSILSFHARHVPSISIEAYLLRILKYCPTTNEVFLGLLVYFDRMSKLGTPGGVGGIKAAVGPRGFAIDSYNIHRLIIAGVTVASKFFSDVFYTNSRYAKVGGLPPTELNQLELQFLLLNNFTLMIPPDEMQRYGDRLLAYWQGREEDAGVSPEVAGELRRQERERERDRQRAAEKRPSLQRASSHQPMDVDKTGTGPTSTSTAPTTPAKNASPTKLARSASLPRRPPSAERSASAGRPVVSFATPGLREGGVVGGQ
ncbi:cyclin-domain-containing protein [Cutaneotrichosporon oleaginosum]|uniref:Cyclin-domain-containing protein n=1 Tax=Cutaneotrichosporon oleaginosum TaxID=879819 RepID=A0A0J0XFD4_9TREE|nr:cyclin-domain-containing protein [Cutaneotrichosporon oleaginosum]KLT39761.1 cyclin-domain-containing protein [Cutaneotrichosporon oleaginosum]TXT05694.1 hypothetical protein COLE_07014 [Cutaneotrichosporon oleaginosum]